MNRFDRAVKKAIARHKRQVTYTKKATSTYTPGGTVSNTTSTFTVDAARVSDRISTTNNGQFVIKDMTLFYISAIGLAFEPKIGETITDATEVFQITKVEKHFAAGELVLYICYC